MTLTNTLRKQVDLPIWEWCRFTPVASTTGTTTCSPDNLLGRYIYYNIAAGSNFWRYDTWSDSWQQLASPINTPAAPTAMHYNSYHGYYGKVIANNSSTQFQAAALFGAVLNGNTIRILSGTGAGQDRTISAVSDPTTADKGVLTTLTTTSITDSLKAWTVNQYVGYQVRIVFNTGVQQIRRILYNSATVLTTADVNYAYGDPYANNIWSVALVATAGATETQYIIESSVYTISSGWTTNPDSSSRFCVQSGGIWCLYNAGTAYGLQYYDVAGDTWYAKTNQSGVISAGVALATDVQIKGITESAGAYLTSTATSGGSTTLTDSGQTMTTNRYANFMIKITGGTGIGQTRTILANTATAFTVYRPWEVNPDATSAYKVFGDWDKIWVAGNATSTLYQYSVEADQMATGKIFDWGTARILAATPAGIGQQAIPLTSITSVTTTATATTAINHNLQTGQTVTISGDTSANSAKFNISATITVTGATTFTYTIVSASGASATNTAVSTTVLVDATKNWPTNSLTGMILQYQTGTATSQTGVSTAVQVQIASNTATSITFAVSTTVVNATSRYAIIDVKAFGTDVTTAAEVTVQSREGTASSGSTTSLVDSSKTWLTNQWSATTNRRLQIIAGTGAGTAPIAITSNNGTTLNYATQTFTPDTTTQYRILDAFGYCTATGATTTLTDANQVWLVNEWAGQTIKFTSGSGSGQQSIIATNTATVLTFSAVTTAPTATTTYSILGNPPTGAGVGIQWAWGTSDTPTKGNFLVVPRGGVTAQICRYDITTEKWRNLSTSPFFETLSTGTTYAYDGANRIYFQKDATNRFYYYDVVNNLIVPASTAPYSVSTAVTGNRMEIMQTADGLQYLYWQRASNSEWYRVLVFW